MTDPGNPTFVRTVIADLTSTHKNWWECDTGIAYIVAHKKEEGWRSRGVKLFDLSDPSPAPLHPRLRCSRARARFVRGASAGALHGPIRLGNRVYFGYGTNAGGIVQIVDRDKLLQGDPTSPDPFAPTAKNILYAQIGRLDTAPHVGAHTTFPVLGIPIPESPRISPAKRPTLLSWSMRLFRMSVVSSGRWSFWSTSPPHQNRFLWRIFRYRRPVAISVYAVDVSDHTPAMSRLRLSTTAPCVHLLLQRRRASCGYP